MHAKDLSNSLSDIPVIALLLVLIVICMICMRVIKQRFRHLRLKEVDTVLKALYLASNEATKNESIGHELKR